MNYKRKRCSRYKRNTMDNNSRRFAGNSQDLQNARRPKNVRRDRSTRNRIEGSELE